jgi:hypothetical protein
MNILLWTLQVLLAVHTAIGAVWKFSNSAAQTMPSLGAIPNGAWLAMGVIELLCAVGLVLPAFGKFPGLLAPIAAILITAEMLLFCVLHVSSGESNYGPMVYWLVVAAICAFIAWGRFALKPF